MNANNVIRTLTIRGQAEGLDKLTADLTKLAGAQENVAVVSEKTAKATLSVDAAWKRSQLRLDEVARSQDNFARATKIADAALAQGIATQEQYARQLGLINERYGQVATSSKQMIAGMTAAGDAGAVASNKMIAGMSSGGAQAAQGIGLARHELINLSRQAQDVGVSLASGQSPLMILAQQGSQIADVFISSGKSVGDFFKQAMSWAAAFAKTPAGIATGILAIGAAAAYAAYQFTRSSTTVEQALENSNRLLKEGKALIDARTSLEARSQLQPKLLTEFEITRNLLDLQRKLNKEREDAERSVSTPTEVPGEMGFAPTAVTGLKEYKSAFDAMTAARDAGLPGLKEYINELGKIGTANPALATSVEKMIALARTGVELEQAEMRLRAIADAMKGVATNAQLAAVGLGSVAQFKLNNRMAEEARDATERQAIATLKIAAAYPGMAVSTALVLGELKDQTAVSAAVKQGTDNERSSLPAAA
jgi:Prophage tail length tape measure protein